VHTNTQVVELRGRGRLEEVVARERTTGEEFHWRPRAAFVFAGLDPNTAFVRDVLELDRWGFVVTDGSYGTSLPGVFAAGDVRAGSTKQLGSAVGEGIAALLSVRDHLRRRLELKDPVAGEAEPPGRSEAAATRGDVGAR
jgi:thioredoxin reductase (NADPH)